MLFRMILILKARQLGISWLCCAYALWLCLFKLGQTVLCFSKGQFEADELLRRIRVLNDRLPVWMHTKVANLTKDNMQTLIWSNGSRVESRPATKGAGRSLTASLVILDEAAFLQWAKEIYTALKPTIDGGGQLIVLSTANGLGNLFHLLWTKSVAGLNSFKTVFLPWWARPGRDAVWYSRMVADSTDPASVKQEYPANPTEAFLASGRIRFHSDWIEAQAENIAQTIATPHEMRHIPELKVYVLPQPGRNYVLGADVAEGLEHGDYSIGVVIDSETWEEIASFHGHWEPDVFADYLHDLGGFYRATIVPERNNHGHAVLATLKRKFTPKVYRAADKKNGWLTNPQTKPISIDALAEGLRDGLITVRTQAALDEMQIYRIEEDGKTSAPTGYNDDYVMAWAIAIASTRTTFRSGAVQVPTQRD